MSQEDWSILWFKFQADVIYQNKRRDVDFNVSIFEDRYYDQN